MGSRTRYIFAFGGAILTLLLPIVTGQKPEDAAARLLIWKPYILWAVVVFIVISVGIWSWETVKHKRGDTIDSLTKLKQLAGITNVGFIPKFGSDEYLTEEIEIPGSRVYEVYMSVISALRTQREMLSLGSEQIKVNEYAPSLPRSLLITSDLPAAGKTTSAFAIATALARSDYRVVLIDADMRKPSLGFATGLSRSGRPGLSDYLAGSARIKEIVQQTIRNNLDAISSGPVPPNPAELLMGRRFPELIHELEALYDVVVIDSPPVIGLADAPELSRYVAAVVMVTRFGTPATDFKNAFDRIQGGPVRAAFLTRAPMK